MLIKSIEPTKLQGQKLKFNAVFVGTLNYDANLEAFNFLAKKVLPMVRKTPGFEDFTLTVIGQTPKDKKLYDYDGVQMAGFVKDLSEYYLAGEIVLAPSFLPGGIKTKVIESLSHGRPTIANHFSLKGLDGIESIALLAEEPEEWVEKIIYVKRNPEEANRKAELGIRYVRKRFGEQIILQSWNNAIKSLSLPELPL